MDTILMPDIKYRNGSLINTAQVTSLTWQGG